MNRNDLLGYVDDVRRIVANGDINKAIILHFDLMMGTYQQRPLFYKHILKFDRFMVAVALLSFSFENPKMPLSRVKDFCRDRDYMSSNSLDSLFSFFETTGFMDIFTYEEDGRQRLFRPTSTAQTAAKNLIHAYVKPSEDMSPGWRGLASLALPHNYVSYYYKGFAKVLDANVLLGHQRPDEKWIMNRDGGHLPMLALYVDNLRNPGSKADQKVATYSNLSSRLGVSHTHIIRMIKEGESRGYFRCNKHQVQLQPEFSELVRRVMINIFAIARVSIELGAAHLGSPN
ncbi:hypothetical protein BW687_001930 [Pseudomonas graminis]|uniref:hypothetical protein n=1 Tax=Pseudomonas graminis TaxID=158627 RepID=UPI00234A3AEE|nr:hypothetical protein [Pseudomonas graminis]MDC6378932.1 hypothetical protein [Pseudomonas graminis]